MRRLVIVMTFLRSLSTCSSLALLAATGCGVGTNVTMLTAERYPPIPRDSVAIYLSAEYVSVEYEDIAFVTARAHSSGDGAVSFAPEADDVVEALQKEAGRIGADAIILMDVGRPGPDSPYEGEAKAIRLLGPVEAAWPLVGEVWEDMLDGSRVLILAIDECATICSSGTEGACVSYGSESEQEGCGSVELFLRRYARVYAQ